MPSMRVARWRWVLVPMVVVVAGCLPQPTPDLPESFLSAFAGTGGRPTFTAQSPPADATGEDIVATLRAQNPESWFVGRAVPVFGVVDCRGDPGCQPGPGGVVGGQARTVWVVLYPDCTGPDDIGWVVVDAVKGVVPGHLIGNFPC